MAKGAWSEMKVGNRSVVMSSEDNDDSDNEKFIPVAFVFNEKKPQFRVHSGRGRDYEHTSESTRK